jgi:diguanylate cyclase (GGDEF)-like protein/PAS domain S-box-containing protein
MPSPYYLHRALIILGFSIAIPAYSETINLQLRWHHQFQFAGYYAALQQGYYKQAGLDVVIHEGSPNKITVNEVLQDHAQYGVANSELVLARLKGNPLVVLAAIGQHSPSVLLARRELNVLSPSDLIGKKIMMMGAKMDADFAVMFSNERISDDKLQIIPSSFDIQDLVTGKVDAFNSYLSNEPYYLKQQGVKFTILNPRNYGVDFYSDMLFTSEQELKRHPERVQAFLEASLKGWQYAFAHPNEIITLLLNDYHVPKSKEHLEFEANALRTLMLPEVVEIGHINPWRLKRVAETFIQAGMVDKATEENLDDFIYASDAARERLTRYIKIIASIAVFACIIVAVLYAAYQSIKRENKYRKQLEKKLRIHTHELALHNHILQKINQSVPLSELLDELVARVEKLHPEMLCSILLLDDEGMLHHGGAPSLPDFYNKAVDGLVIGDGVGSCGTAAYRGERFIVEDVQQHPFWASYRDLTKQAGIRSCWSQPIKNNQSKVLGTFAIYHTDPCKISNIEIDLIENYALLAQIAIERLQADMALQESEQRLMTCQFYGGIGSWEVNLSTNRQIWSPSVSQVLGFPELENPKLEDFLAVIHPEDRQAVIDATQAHINHGTPYDVEYRITNTKQQLRWMRSVGRIDKTKSHYFRGIIHDITDRKVTEEQIKQLAFYDSLTQLPNRRLLNERLQQSIEQGLREGLQQAVLMLDLDRFKAVNDSLGHKAGDELLQQVAERISEQLRKVDTVARLGGDEFVVLLVNINRCEDVERVALAIINELSRPFLLRKTDTVNIGTSIGIAFYPQHGDSPEILMDIADAALYQAKEQGRGCFCIAD